jgi:RNase P/RNase MRP subunit POP5
LITRHKNRYILVESSDILNTRQYDTASSLMSAFHSQVGNVGFSEMSPKLMHQVNDRVFIMRINRDHERKAVLALAFIKSVGNRKIGLYTIRISGTIRALKTFCSAQYK